MFMHVRPLCGARLPLSVGALAALFIQYLTGHACHSDIGSLVHIAMGLAQSAIVRRVVSQAGRQPRFAGGSAPRGAPWGK